MNVLAFLAANWDSVLVVVAFLAVVVVLIKRGETKILKQILFNLVTQAEKQFGSGTGSLKYAAVADWIYQRIPAVLKLLFTSNDIEKLHRHPIRGKPACRHRRTGRPDRTRRKLNTSDSDKNESPSGVIPRRAFFVSCHAFSYFAFASFKRGSVSITFPVSSVTSKTFFKVPFMRRSTLSIVNFPSSRVYLEKKATLDCFLNFIVIHPFFCG